MGWTEYWKHHHPLRLWEWKLKLNFHLFWTTHSHTSTPEWFDCQWLRKKRHTLPYLEICRLEKALCLFEVHPHCWLCWSYTTLPDFFGPAIITTTTRGRRLTMIVDMGRSQLVSRTTCTAVFLLRKNWRWHFVMGCDAQNNSSTVLQTLLLQL